MATSIVIDARESGTSTGRYIDKLIEYLHKLKPAYSITILTTKDRLDFIKKIAPNFTTIECSYKEFTFAEQLGLLKQLRDLKPDLVFFPAVQQPVLYRGKTVTTMQDLTTIRFRNPTKNWLVFTVKRFVYKIVNKYIAHKATALIAPSQFVKDDVARFARINSRRITVTYEAADHISEAAEPIPELQDKRFIMYVGRPQPHKNLPRLVTAFASLRQQYPDLHLVLAGKQDALYKKLARDVRQEALGNVDFTGFVSEGQLRWLYENTAAYIFPSLSEGFGLPSLEAMMHGAPVVSSNATCLPEINQDGALYFDPEDTADMAAQISKVLDNGKLATDLVKKGTKVVNKYSWQRMAEQTLAVFEEALER